jgi:alpha-beta hydrolase superfamily lysophospholipase
MQIWNPPGKDAHADAPTILFVPGAAVDHQIFALPTIKKNAVDYFREAGYRIYCITHRIGKTMTAQKGYTTFDARHDILAALAYIRKVQEADAHKQAEKIYVIAHCAGSIALSMGLLHGTIPADWIKGITASNVFMNPMFAKVDLVKASLPIPMNNIYSKVAGTWFSCTSSTDDSLVQKVLNQALRFYPVGEKDEICNSVVCHRSSLVFGRYIPIPFLVLYTLC